MEDEQNQGDGLESRTIRLPPELAAWWDETGAETIREGLDEWMQDERRWSAQEAAYWAGRPIEADAEARKPETPPRAEGMILPVRDGEGRLVGRLRVRENLRVGDDVALGPATLRCSWWAEQYPAPGEYAYGLEGREIRYSPYLALPAGVDPARLPLLPVEDPAEGRP